MGLEIGFELGIGRFRHRGRGRQRDRDIARGAHFVHVIEQCLGITLRHLQAVLGRVGELAALHVSAHHVDEALFGVVRALDRGQEGLMVEIAARSDEGGKLADLLGDAFVGHHQSVIGDDGVEGGVVDQALQHALGDAHRLRLVGRERLAGSLGLAAQDVLVLTLIDILWNFHAADRGHGAVRHAREDVGDAPHAKTERQSPQKQGGDPRPGEFSHLLKHDNFRTWR